MQIVHYSETICDVLCQAKSDFILGENVQKAEELVFTCVRVRVCVRVCVCVCVRKRER